MCLKREEHGSMKHKKSDFCVLFILWGEVISKEDRKTTNEVELQIVEWFSNFGNPQ